MGGLSLAAWTPRSRVPHQRGTQTVRPGGRRSEPESFDRVYAISTSNTSLPDDLDELVDDVRRVLAPGGKVVLTIDLFLDLRPFTSRSENEWGQNVDVRALVDRFGLQLVAGDPKELNGYPEFEPESVLANLSQLMIGNLYPALAQALVLERTS